MRGDAKAKIFRSYALLITASTMLIMLILLLVVSGSNSTNAVYRQQEILSGDLSELQATLNRMELVSSQANSSNELISMFVSLSDDGDPGNYFDDNLLDFIRAGSVLETIHSLSNSLLRICVFNDAGDMVSAGQLDVDRDTAGKALTGDLVETLYARLPAGGGLLVGPHADWWSPGKQAVVSYITTLHPTFGGANYGLIEVEILAENLTGMNFMQRDDGCTSLILNADGEAVGRPDFDAGPILHALEAAGSGMHAAVTLDGLHQQALIASLDETGWRLLRLAPQAELMRPYFSSYAAILLGVLALLGLMLLIAWRMAVRVSRPLHNFAEAISGVTIDNMKLPPLEKDRDRTEEVEQLDRAFRAVLSKLNSSIGLEMKAYLNALQSQMDPHFLYNILTVMAETADVDGSAHTVAMCQRLSQMLRYMASYENNAVTLADEVNYLRTYLELMHDRYDNWFSYEIHEEPAMMQIGVPKMILQPLAENCFQHGFKKVRPPWRVEVDMRIEDGRWLVCVRDNGGGISEDEIHAIYQTVNRISADVATNYQQMRIGGLGLVNTVLRLRITQPKGTAVFRVENLPEHGTMVTIGGKL